MNESPWVVYHLLDAEDCCVYIGHTKRRKQREREHRIGPKRYARLVVVASAMTKLAVLRTELQMIHELKPIYNVAGVVKSRLEVIRRRMGLVAI